jgi:hypothetical protein
MFMKEAGQLVSLGVHTEAEFVYEGIHFDTLVTFRVKDACYLEILTPLAGMRMPPPGTALTIVWHLDAMQWQQDAVVVRIDLSDTPLLQLSMQCR